MSSRLINQLEYNRKRVESAIETFLPVSSTRPSRLHQAMHYSMSAGGKRIRPALIYFASALNGEPLENPDGAAVAIECLHTYTLIHDDLPSIDNSDLRRGRASSHIEFDEATAILAGDSLLNFAFELLHNCYKDRPKLGFSLVGELANHTGSQTLIGGQMEDILSENKQIEEETLQYIHKNKTAALLTAGIRMGLCFTDATESDFEAASEAGLHLGLLFQIVDDLLDATSTSAELGKPVGKDFAVAKSTYVSLYGIEGAYQKAREHADKSVRGLNKIEGNTALLEELVSYLLSRTS